MFLCSRKRKKQKKLCVLFRHPEWAAAEGEPCSALLDNEEEEAGPVPAVRGVWAQCQTGSSHKHTRTHLLTCSCLLCVSCFFVVVGFFPPISHFFTSVTIKLIQYVLHLITVFNIKLISRVPGTALTAKEIAALQSIARPSVPQLTPTVCPSPTLSDF